MEAYTKNPATLPTADIRAAHALPTGCLVVGRVSTTRARSRAWTRRGRKTAMCVNAARVLTSVDTKVYTINGNDGKPDGKGVVLLRVS